VRGLLGGAREVVTGARERTREVRDVARAARDGNRDLRERIRRAREFFREGRGALSVAREGIGGGERVRLLAGGGPLSKGGWRRNAEGRGFSGGFLPRKDF
jgi:hypothetical protein